MNRHSPDHAYSAFLVRKGIDAKDSSDESNAITRCDTDSQSAVYVLTRVLGKCALFSVQISSALQKFQLANFRQTLQVACNISVAFLAFHTGHFYDRQPLQVFECQTLWTEKIAQDMSDWKVSTEGTQCLGFMPWGSSYEVSGSLYFLEWSWIILKLDAFHCISLRSLLDKDRLLVNLILLLDTEF